MVNYMLCGFHLIKKEELRGRQRLERYPETSNNRNFCYPQPEETREGHGYNNSKVQAEMELCGQRDPAISRLRRERPMSEMWHLSGERRNRGSTE